MAVEAGRLLMSSTIQRLVHQFWNADHGCEATRTPTVHTTEHTIHNRSNPRRHCNIASPQRTNNTSAAAKR